MAGLAEEAEVDEDDASAVADFMAMDIPYMVILATARVGGIHANNTHRDLPPAKSLTVM
jgi:hypothetical protein